MDRCININHPEFIALAKAANINPLILKSKVGVWQEKNGSDRFPTLEELNIEKSYARPSFSIPQNPDIIPLTEESIPIYKHYNLLNTKGEIKLFKTQKQINEAEKWVKFNNENAKGYSFALRKQEDGYRIFIAKKFSSQGSLFGAITIEETEAEEFPMSENNKESLMAFYNTRKAQLEVLNKSYETFTRLNEYRKHTSEYQKIKSNFLKAKVQLENELEKIDIKDVDTIFATVDLEIDKLIDFLGAKMLDPSKGLSEDNIEIDADKFSSELFGNLQVDARMDNLSLMFEGRNIEGNTLTTDENFKGIGMLDSTGLENFNKISDKYKLLKKAYEKSYEAITRKLILESPNYQYTIETLEEDERQEFKDSVEKLFQSRKDISILESQFLGVNSFDDTAAKTAINLVYQYEIQRAQQNIRQSCEDLVKADEKLTKKRFDMNKFLEKDKHGTLTGNIISPFSKVWNLGLSEYFEYVRDIFETKGKERFTAYNKHIAWLKNNTEVIDFTKLSHFKAIYGEIYPEYFTATDEEMEEYQASLMNLLGRYYNEVIHEVEEKLNYFEEVRGSLRITGGARMMQNITQRSPWEFIRNYYGLTPTKAVEVKVEDKNFKVLVRSEFINFVPKKTKKDTRGRTYSTGYYNEDFYDIQRDEDAYDYWRITKELYTKHTNPTFSTLGQNISTMSYGKFVKSAIEVLADRGNSTLVKRAYDIALKSFQDMFTESKNRRASTDTVVRNYSDNTKSQIREFTDILVFKDLTALLEMASDRGISLNINLDKVLTEKDEKEAIREIAEVIARHDILQMYSRDLTKITTALADLAALHRARLETAQVAEVLKRYHNSITNPDGSRRYKSEESMKTYIKDNIYNQRDIETFMEGQEKNLNIWNRAITRSLSQGEQKLIGIIKEVKPNGMKKETMFYFEGQTYFGNKGKYFILDKEGEIEENLTKEEFEAALELYFASKTEGLGKGWTIASMFQGLLKAIVIKSLALNPKSGVFNRLEGMLTNIIRDHEGSFWKSGNLEYARQDMKFANIYRVFGKKLHPSTKAHKDQLQTFIMLFEKTGVYQDKKNELDRRDNVSQYNKVARKLDVYQFAVDLPEFMNQAEIVHCMLQDFTINDVNGVSHDFYDKKTNTWVAFIPGTTQLKPEFRTAENMGWETFHLQDEAGMKNMNNFFVAKTKIDDMIKRTQGNYSKIDSIGIHNKILGRVLMLFMRWFPEHLNQRFGMRTGDVVQGKAKYIGRFNMLYSNLPAIGIYGAFFTLMKFGLGPVFPIFTGGFILLPFIIKMVMKNKLQTDKTLLLNAFNLRHSAAILQEAIVQSMNFPLTFVKVPATLKIGEKNIGLRVQPIFKAINIDNMVSDENTELTKAQASALKGLAQEMANMIGITLVYLLAKGLIDGGDDDDDKDRKDKRIPGYIERTRFSNYLTNSYQRLFDSFTSWAMPNTLIDANSKLAILRTLDDLIKVCKVTDKWLESGSSNDLEKVIHQTLKIQPVFPIPNTLLGLPFGEVPFLDKQVYQSGNAFWLNKAMKSPEQKAKTELGYIREPYKEALESYYWREIEELEDYRRKEYGESYNPLTQEEKEILVEKKVQSDYRKKTYKKKEESYQEALLRVEKEIQKDKQNRLSRKKEN